MAIEKNTTLIGWRFLPEEQQIQSMVVSILLYSRFFFWLMFKNVFCLKQITLKIVSVFIKCTQNSETFKRNTGIITEIKH